MCEVVETSCGRGDFPAAGGVSASTSNPHAAMPAPASGGATKWCDIMFSPCLVEADRPTGEDRDHFSEISAQDAHDKVACLAGGLHQA